MSRDRIIRAGTLIVICAVLAVQIAILAHARGRARNGELPVLAAPMLRGPLR